MTQISDLERQVEIKKETFDIYMQISNLLDTGLDEETLSYCVRLCENGVNPECLASVVRELRRETAALKQAEEAALQQPADSNTATTAAPRPSDSTQI